MKRILIFIFKKHAGKKRGDDSGGEIVNTIRFADDTVIRTESLGDLQRSLGFKKDRFVLRDKEGQKSEKAKSVE